MIIKRLILMIFMIILMLTFNACYNKNAESMLEDQLPYHIVDGIVHYNPPVYFSQNYIIPMGGEHMFAPGHDIRNNNFVNWSKNVMGIVWEPKWVVNDRLADKQRIELALASNDLPNVIKAPASEIIMLAKSDVLLPLDDLIDQYASPLLKFLLQEANEYVNGQLYAALKFNGSIYAMPTVLDAWAGKTSTHWIRKDVLDTLELSVPTTLKDYEKVLSSFKEKYPDQSPHYMEINSVGQIIGSEVITNALGAFPRSWIKEDKGNLVYGSIQPAMKDSLQILSEWYQKGWLDKQFILNKSNQNFISGKALSLYGPWWYVHNIFTDTSKSNPEAVIVPVPLFKETKEASFINSFPFGEGTAISKKTEHPEAVILQFNEYVESFFRNHQDLRDKFDFKYEAEPYGINYEYKREGPQYFNYPDAKSMEDKDSTHLIFGMRINQRVTQLYDSYDRIQKALSTSSENLLSEMDQYEMLVVRERLNEYGHNLHIELYHQQHEEGLYNKYNQFFGSPTPTMIDKQAYLNKIEEETFINIIMGLAPINQFDSFVENWKRAGGDQITREVNQWYQDIN